MDNLKQGAEGDLVKALQADLNKGCNAGLKEDGIFGPLTDAAVRKFQADAGLSVDGVVGADTRSELAKAL